MEQNITISINYDEIDYEIRDLVRYVNQVKGIRTTESCCGHDESPCIICCIADTFADLKKFMYTYFYCDSLWHIEPLLTDIDIDNNDWDKVQFMLKSDIQYSDYPVKSMMIRELTQRFELYNCRSDFNKMNTSLTGCRNIAIMPDWVEDKESKE